MIRIGRRAAGGALLGVATLVAATVAGAGSATAHGTTHHRAPTHVAGGATAAAGGYYKAVPSCAAPKPGHVSCLALHLVRVSATTPDARRLPAGRSLSGGPAGGYTPYVLARAYGVHPNTPTKQVVGIVDAYDDVTALQDLNTFDRKYGLPKETKKSFKKVSDTGSKKHLPKADADWGDEISLDLDAVRGLCHKCRIVLVEADNSSGKALSRAENEAVRMGATVISNSYGGDEGKSKQHKIAHRYDHKKVVILASSGDSGYYGWDTINAHKKPGGTAEVPSTYRSVIAVGGTTLQLNNNGSRAAETVWNNDGSLDLLGRTMGAPIGASGGGCSKLYRAQHWQRKVAGWSQTGCGQKRLATDVSALADPFTGYDIYDSTPDSHGYHGWQTYGGTSLASPLMAAMFALAGGAHGVDYPAQTLYRNFAAHKSDFYDVRAGGNGWCGGGSVAECKSIFPKRVGPNKYFHSHVDCAFKGRTSKKTGKTRACDAATGYDGPSGVGTPRGVKGLQPHTH